MVVEKPTLVRQSESGTDVLDMPLPLTSGETRRSLPYLSGLIAVLFWGTTPAATVLVTHDIPSSFVGPSRLLLAAAFLLPIVLIVRPSLPNDRGGWTALAINGVVGFSASFFLQGLGFSRTTTSHAALILACAPVMTSIIQNMLSQTFPRTLWLIGSAIALCGEAVLIFARSSADVGNSGTLVGDFIVLIGTITVSIGYVAGANLSSRIGLFGATAWSILFGAPFYGAFIAIFDWCSLGVDGLGGRFTAFSGSFLYLDRICRMVLGIG
jgi:drug/metabolite transporter (DMT)-like permease